MKAIGRVRDIWRYPVKSMAGERLDEAFVDAGGIPGDRGWAVRDERRGGIRGAKKIAGLMRLSARYLETPTRAEPRVPEIGLPDGSRVRADAPDAAARVSAAVETPVTLWPLLPESEREHYRRGPPDHKDVLTELRSIFGRTPDEPLPDLSNLPRELFEFESLPGTYFDAFPLHLVSTASLDALAKAAPGSRVDVRRFRPNFVVETGPGLAGFADADWAGKRLRIGDLELGGDSIATVRCVMVTHGFADLPKDPTILRAIVRAANQTLGLYARPRGEARVRVGDEVVLLD
ncbi:MAG TPA: MOSC domain-containing protein [Myxococcota bacterium]|nr:MOSC domain-containing protein [Myxococcota bacterium]